MSLRGSANFESIDEAISCVEVERMSLRGIAALGSSLGDMRMVYPSLTMT
jgi:hypothetical protein